VNQVDEVSAGLLRISTRARVWDCSRETLYVENWGMSVIVNYVYSREKRLN
jgi:hypothetical protein